MDEELDSIFNSGVKITPQAGASGNQATSSPLNDLDDIFKPQAAAPSSPQQVPDTAGDLDDIFGVAPAPQAAPSLPLGEEQAPEQAQLPSERPGYIEAFNNAVSR